VKIKKQH